MKKVNIVEHFKKNSKVYLLVLVVICAVFSYYVDEHDDPSTLTDIVVYSVGLPSALILLVWMGKDAYKRYGRPGPWNIIFYLFWVAVLLIFRVHALVLYFLLTRASDRMNRVRT